MCQSCDNPAHPSIILIRCADVTSIVLIRCADVTSIVLICCADVTSIVLIRCADVIIVLILITICNTHKLHDTCSYVGGRLFMRRRNQNWTELSWEGGYLSSVPRLRVAVATAPPAGVSCYLESGGSTMVMM